MCAVSVRPGLLVTHFGRVVIVVNEIPARQQVSGECWMRCIDARVQDRDFDGTVWPSAFCHLMGQRQFNLLWRPLRNECSVVAANTPGVADAPRIAAADRWFRNEIGFNENNAGITGERVYSIGDRSVIGDAQSEYGPVAELIERSRIE